MDRLLVQQGLAVSREAAVRTILAGGVLVDGIVVDKPARLVARGARLEIERAAPFVSRAGEKWRPPSTRSPSIQAVWSRLTSVVRPGASPIASCNGEAERVYAVDVGYGLIDWKLRQDPGVVLLERTNIRYIDRSLIPEPVDLAVIDVSFISLTLVLPSCAFVA